MNKRTKLMDRIFSAIEKDEKELTTQVNNDLDIALEDGVLDTEEYSMKKMSDNEVEIHDKINDEDTIAKVSDDNVELTAKECNKAFSDSPWYIVTKDGKTVFTGTANECRAEWNEKGYKMPDYLVTPVTMEEATPATTPKKKTFSEGKSKRFSDTEPTPNQEGADYELKQWIEAHPGQAKYIAELGAKWGTDKILEGLEHDMNEGK